MSERIIYQDGDYRIYEMDGTHYITAAGREPKRLGLIKSHPLSAKMIAALRKAGANPADYLAIGEPSIIRRAAAPAWDAEVESEPARSRARYEAAHGWRMEYDRLTAAVERAESASYHDPARIIKARRAVEEYMVAHPEVADRLKAEARPTDHHWAYSEGAVNRALRGED